MKTKVYALLSILFFVLPVLAQEIEIKVMDKEQKPISFANVIVKNRADSSYITGGITNEQGIYRLATKDAPDPSLCFATISCMGYHEQSTGPLNQFAFTIVLQEDVTLLSELVVTIQRPTIKLYSDGLKVSLNDSPLTQLGTAMEVVKQLPLITVEDEKIKVLGSGEPIIYINHRKMRSVTELREISSQEVTSVKIITQPGAEYDASVKSVLLIETKRPHGEGFGGWAYISGEKRRLFNTHQLVNLQYRKGGLDLDVSLYNKIQKQRDRMLFFTHLPSTPAVDMMDSIVMEKKIRNQELTLSANYIVNPQHSLGARYTLDHSPDIGGKANINSTAMVGTEESVSINNLYNSSCMTSHHLNLYYAGQVSETYRLKLDADLYHSSNEIEQKSELVGVSDVNFATYEGFSNLASVRVINLFSLWGGQLSVGGEGSYTNTVQTFKSDIKNIGSNQNELINQALAGFLSFSKTFHKVQAEAGLRYEFNRFDYYEKEVLQEEQSKVYNHLFPNLSLGYNGFLMAQLSYNSYIQRPMYRQLDNTIQYNTAHMYEGGNPYLLPTITHQFSLNLMKWGAVLGAYYNLMKDPTYFDISLYKGEPILFGQQKNAKRQALLLLFLNYRTVVGKWQPDITLSMSQPFFEVYGTSYNEPIWGVSFKNAIELPYNTSLWVNYLFNSTGHNSTNLSTRAIHSLSLQLSKWFLGDKLQLLLSFSDLLNTSIYESTTGMNGLQFSDYRDVDQRGASLRLSYYFNRKKDRYKGSQSSNELDRL